MGGKKILQKTEAFWLCLFKFCLGTDGIYIPWLLELHCYLCKAFWWLLFFTFENGSEVRYTIGMLYNMSKEKARRRVGYHACSL